MAIRDKDTLKSWFLRGARPLASQFADWIDSFWHTGDKLPISSVENLSDVLNAKANMANVEQMLVEHDGDEHAHPALRHKIQESVSEDIEEHNLDESAHQYIQERIDAEAQARADADAALQTAIEAEAQARQTADTTEAQARA
ncbi:MAG: hypothetical protein LBD53_01035, partial [Tannerella sp.]|nr:hypothetical protein [Tannerella sp.]